MNLQQLTKGQPNWHEIYNDAMHQIGSQFGNGIWTPVIYARNEAVSPAVETATPVQAHGTWYRTGQIVHAFFDITGGDTQVEGNMLMRGLPFPRAGETQYTSMIGVVSQYKGWLDNGYPDVGCNFTSLTAVSIGMYYPGANAPNGPIKLLVTPGYKLSGCLVYATI